MKLSTEKENEIVEAYKSFWVANLSANMEIFGSYLVDDFSIIGSAKGETFFSRKDTIAFYAATADELKDKADLRNRSISVQPIDGHSVILNELCDLYVLIENDWTFYGHARISCVMKKIEGEWKALHQHASFPDHRTEEGQQLAVEKIEKENFALKEAVERRTVELKHKNRELEIEAALERVRSRSMAMHKSEELKDVIHVVFEQFINVNIPVEHTGFIIDYKERDDMHIWLADQYASPFEINIPYFDSPHWNSFRAAKENGEHFFTNLLNFDQKNKFYSDLFKLIPALPEDSQKELFNKPGLAISTALLDNVGLYIENFSAIPFTDEDNNTLLRFGKVFQQTYTRFLDLQKAEVQTREAEIELALERVRARTMAMQHSKELGDVSFLLDSQVRALGIPTRGCVVNIYGENESTEWFSSGTGTMPTYKTPREGLFLRYYEAGQRGESIHIESFEGEACKAHYEYLCTIPIMGDGLRAMIAAGGSFPEKQVDHTVYFKYGYLLFITLEPAPEAHDIFLRFTKVFEQTYTRFLDLQKAEAQTLRAEHDLVEIKAARQKAEDALTELKITQKQLIQSEKMASLGELTAGIAHEIQNPLNFVNNFSEINLELIEEVKSQKSKLKTEELDELLDDIAANQQKINHHGKRADAIVKGMLQHSQSGKGQKEPTDINALCDEYLRLSYHGLRAKDKSFNAILKTDLDESIGKVNIVSQDIGRVIMNLLNNAFYAVNEKTTDHRRQTTEESYTPMVTLSTKKISGKIEITIADNGNGIPQHIIDKIFQPFFTTKPTGQGTGLGLSLAYDIVKAHGGDLKVETREREGTRFTVILPGS